MAINKVIVNGETKIDLTADTVTTEDVKQGVTFHDATGALKTGTGGNGIDGFYIKRVCTAGETSGDQIDVYVSTSGNYEFFSIITSTLAVNSWHNHNYLNDGILYVIATQPISSVDWYITSSSSSY